MKGVSIKTDHQLGFIAHHLPLLRKMDHRIQRQHHSFFKKNLHRDKDFLVDGLQKEFTNPSLHSYSAPQITITTPQTKKHVPPKKGSFQKGNQSSNHHFWGDKLVFSRMLQGPGTTEPVFGVALSGMPWDEPGQESNHLDEFYRFWNTVFPRKKAV